ncbi:MAG: protein kinase [Terriglobia bacterium]
MEERLEKNRRSGGGVAESTGDTDIDQLLRARSEIDSALRRHKTQFTVFFTDIVGSTSFFERYGDTAGLMMLQRHSELVLPAIEEAGGTLVKTIGDAVLAVFSSPTTAVRTAITIHQRLDAYDEDRPPDDQIFTRTGINFGHGFVKEKDIFGDVVNVAARLVKACAPAQILISRSVHEGVEKQPGIRCRKLGTAAFHGKVAPQEIYEVVWTSTQRYQRLRHQLDGEAGSTSRNLLGRYELLDELGRGAMGVVYKAYDPTVGRIVGLKTVRLTATGDEREELVRRLRQEAQAAGRLEHPNIVTIYDAGEAGGLFYLTMQFVKGRTLAELIAERNLLPVQQILLLFDQVCEGLHYAHERGIIHRDLKPSNFIVTREGMVKIVDFGIAKLTEAGTTVAGMVLGTPSYMSPEQAQGGRVDRRSDIFSLGSILYELLVGERAFPGNTPTAIIYKILHEDPIPLRVIEPGIDPALEKIVRKALAKQPQGRYQSCRELQADLKAAAKASVKASVEVKAPPAPPRRVRRALTAVLALFLWTGLGFYVWRQGWFSTWGLLPARGSQPAAAESAPALTSVDAQPPSEASLTDEQGPGGESDAAAAQTEAGAPGAEKTSPEKEGIAGVAAPPSEPFGGTEQKPGRESSPPISPAARSAPRKAPRRPAIAPAHPALSPEKQREVRQWFTLAARYNARGRYREAIFALKQVLRIDPNNQQAEQKLERVRQRLALQRRNRSSDQ